MLYLPAKGLIKGQKCVQLYKGLPAYDQCWSQLNWLVTSGWGIQTNSTELDIRSHFGYAKKVGLDTHKRFWGDFIKPSSLEGYELVHRSKWTRNGYAFLSNLSGKNFSFVPLKVLDGLLRATKDECGEYGARLWAKKCDDPLFLTSGEFHQASIVAVIAPCVENFNLVPAKDLYAVPLDGVK